MKDFKDDKNDIDGEPASKRTCLGLDDSDQTHRNPIPLGLQWTQNSCAYDASFVILYSLYSGNHGKWSTHFQSFQNSTLNKILEEFQMLLQNEKTFEQALDHIREALEVEDYIYFCFGCFTSLPTLWEHILKTPQAVRKTYQQCENGHRFCTHYFNTGIYSLGVNPNGFTALSQCFMREPELSPRSCRQCSKSLIIYHEFVSAKLLLALEFSGFQLQINNHVLVKIDNVEHNYSLAGIVYYGSDHFTARIILQDGQIWFHDGITTGQTTIYDGSLALNCPDLSTCRGKHASIVLYSLD